MNTENNRTMEEKEPYEPLTPEEERLFEQMQAIHLAAREKRADDRPLVNPPMSYIRRRVLGERVRFAFEVLVVLLFFADFAYSLSLAPMFKGLGTLALLYWLDIVLSLAVVVPNVLSLYWMWRVQRAPAFDSSFLRLSDKKWRVMRVDFIVAMSAAPFLAAVAVPVIYYEDNRANLLDPAVFHQDSDVAVAMFVAGLLAGVALSAYVYYRDWLSNKRHLRQAKRMIEKADRLSSSDK